MDKETRTIATLEEIHDELTCLREDLADDGFEEYADALQDGLDRITNLLYVLTHKDLLEEQT